jgi:hypothetical protein
VGCVVDVVEVDGGYHSQRVIADVRHTRALERLGYRVLRLDAELVSRQLPLAVAAIRNYAGALAPRLAASTIRNGAHAPSLKRRLVHRPSRIPSITRRRWTGGR